MACSGQPMAQAPACTPVRCCSHSSGSRGSTSFWACCFYSSSAVRSLTVRGRQPLPSPEPDRLVRRWTRMVEIWFAIAFAMLATYIVLDGFDFGAGSLHLIVAKNDQERRQVLAAI